MSNTSIIITSTRTDTNVSWLQSNITDSTNYTTDEYENIVLPYWEWIQSLDGFQSVVIRFPDEYTKETVYTFDTTSLDSANAAWSIINSGGGQGNARQNPFAFNMNTLSRIKASERTPERANNYTNVSWVTSD
jgi:hypothetical protein